MFKVAIGEKFENNYCQSVQKKKKKKKREGKREEKEEWQLQSFLRYTQTQKVVNYLFDLSKTFLITIL